MNRKIIWSLAAVCVFSANLSQAAVVSRDWKVEGDGLLTYDDVNQREWLDVPVTLLSTFPNGFGGVLAELEPGGQFDEFTWATRDDVFALAESAGIDTTITDLQANKESATSLVELLGPTTSFPPGGSARSRGFLNQIDPACDCHLIGNVFFGSVAGVNTSLSVAVIDLLPVTGLFLYREAVPEPSSSILVGSLVFCLLLGGHRARALEQ